MVNFVRASVVEIFAFQVNIGTVLFGQVFGMENRDSSVTDDSNAVAPLTAPGDSRDTTTPVEDVITTPESTTETPVIEPEEETGDILDAESNGAK